MGFLIDPDHTSTAEARQRVIDAWVAGARLFDLDGSLLLVLPAPVSVRAERAPGLPVLGRDGQLVIERHGSEVAVNVDELAPVALSTILDIAGLRLDVLSPAPDLITEGPPVEYPVESAPPPSVRTRAGVGRPAAGTARRAERLVNEMKGLSAPTNGAPRRPWFRPPITPMLRRRHARYLDQLTKSFEGRDWEEALRSAISLGGSARGALTTRLPRRRRGPLRPGTAKPGGATQVPYGPTVHQHLRGLYTDAAKQLEADGHLLQAAFVYADLLDNPIAAVDLLERHALFVEAAELAEARVQDPAAAVRLWWRAGDRERAIQVASRRGAYAAAVSRLQQVDPDSALELRRAWMRDRRSAGDPIGAITAAWPAEDLRRETIPDIGSAIAQGGSAAGEALAHWLELAPTPEAVETARSLLGEGPELDAARRTFVSALSTHTVGDPTLDRELTSSALLALAIEPAPLPTQVFHDVSARLQKRADPLLVADLPRLKMPLRKTAETPSVDVSTTGNVEIHDAVAIGHNSVLVALGELGAQMLTTDGRVRASWDIPTHRVVIADHGGRALLITDRAPRYLVHQVDLPNHRPVPLPALDTMPLDTYDGSRPVLVTDRGIEWVEQANDRWRLAWRDLNHPGQQIHQVSRTAQSMSALFTEAGLHTFHWELPSLTLRQRGTIEPAQSVVVVATGEVGRFHQESGVAALDWHSPHGHRLTTSTLQPDGEAFVWVSGSAFAIGDQTDSGIRLGLHARRDSAEIASIRTPPGIRPLFRSFQSTITTGHTAGRVVVIDADANVVTAEITLRI